jgi:hypothetical protein
MTSTSSPTTTEAERRQKAGGRIRQANDADSPV